MRISPRSLRSGMAANVAAGFGRSKRGSEGAPDAAREPGRRSDPRPRVGRRRYPLPLPGGPPVIRRRAAALVLAAAAALGGGCTEVAHYVWPCPPIPKCPPGCTNRETPDAAVDF